MIGAARLPADPFMGPDPIRLHAVALDIGQRFQAAYAPLALAHIADATMDPTVLLAAYGKAHATGLAGSIAAGAGDDVDSLIDDLAHWLRAEVAALRGQ